jgi:hypothetical protein
MNILSHAGDKVGKNLANKKFKCGNEQFEKKGRERETK